MKTRYLAAVLAWTIVVQLPLSHCANAETGLANLQCERVFKGGKRPTPEELQNMLATRNIPRRLCGADLRFADLSGADLSYGDLRNAALSNANLSNANLSNADLRYADPSDANLSNAKLNDANLSNADLRGAKLVYADLTDTDLSGADLSSADLTGAIFEPKDLPPTRGIWSAKHLSEMVYLNRPTALFTLRKKFREGGLHPEEREITYAIKRSEANHTDSLIEAWFNYAMFDLTCQYGMSPGRPLRILASLILLFAVPYGIVLYRQSGSGIWLVWSKERVLLSEGQDTPTRVTEKSFSLVWTAFYFSLLSAFNIGWKEINVGNWISRLQPHEYNLRATHRVRTISALQSLISVYLLALWVLTYFGRPFG